MADVTCLIISPSQSGTFTTFLAVRVITLHATGIARAMKKYKKPGVSISSQGESSVSEGYCYEAINGADNEKLPVIFVFQDNGYGISVPKKDQTNNEKVADNFIGFKNTTIIYCDGKDVFDSLSAMKRAKEVIANGHGPVIVHADCVRIGSHSNSDKHELYRDEKEREEAKAQDPLLKFENELLSAGALTKSEIEKIEAEIKDEVIDAHKKAMTAPTPTEESIWEHLYAPEYECEKYPLGVHHQEGEEIKLITAINETLKAEFRHNPDTFIWGQDMANKDKGGIFNVSKGMQQEFGEERVFNAPIAEDFIMGTANGFSRLDKKIRVVVEGAEFADYFCLQWSSSSSAPMITGEAMVPLLRMSPLDSLLVDILAVVYITLKNLEGTFTTLPGVRVVCPSFVDDAAGLLRTCMRSVPHDLS